MSEELSPKTFDLVGMLSGRDYPTQDIEVYFDEVLGFSIEKLKNMLRSLEILDKKDEAKKVSSELEALVKKTESSKFVITLKGIPEKVRRSILEKVQEEFPEKFDMLGRPLPNPKGDEAYTLAMWGAYAQTLTTPDGTKVVMSEQDVRAIYDDAPPAVHTQLTKGIESLREDAVKGFEYAAQEADFLSHASPEG